MSSTGSNKKEFKMKEIVLATNNNGKVDEFHDFFAGMNVKFVPQSKFAVKSVDEVGLTFIENAIIKARHAAKLTGLPAIGDDSGLSIDALNGAPGIHTARYGGEHGNFTKNIEKVLSELKSISEEKRTAQVHCVLAYMRHELDPVPIICHGVWEVMISFEPKGTKGFGFDPIIYVPSHQCTAGEMDPEVKNSISHRAKAVKQLLSKVETSSFALA